MLRPLPSLNPHNRWHRTEVQYDPGQQPQQSLELFDDDSVSILSENKSPDVPFRFSVNPYRGCTHGCAYCYARPTHEYLGFGSGTDFERKLISVTFWDAQVARSIEPYAPAPARRIETIHRLSDAGIAVGVNVAPLIPGLSDRDLVPILQAARTAGAIAASTQMLRLPGSAADVFVERLRQALPLQAEKVLKLIRAMRHGELDDPRFHARMRGHGGYADTLTNLYEVTVRRLGFSGFPATTTDSFRRPSQQKQLSLFEQR